MAGRYVTPTDRPQWPWRFITLVLCSYVLPFALSFAAVYVLLRAYFAAGGSW